MDKTREYLNIKYDVLENASVEEIALHNKYLSCEHCGKGMGENVQLIIGMTEHDEGDPETGPRGPEVYVICVECQEKLEKQFPCGCD